MDDLEGTVYWGDVWKEHGEPLEFYHEHHDGLTRGQLENEDLSLYRRLLRDGLIDEIPLGKVGRPRKYGDDPVAYYQEHFPGLTRGQLKNESSGLYNRLWRDGLLKHIPLKLRKKK